MKRKPERSVPPMAPMAPAANMAPSARPAPLLAVDTATCDSTGAGTPANSDGRKKTPIDRMTMVETVPNPAVITGLAIAYNS